MERILEGQSALITGSTSGIGLGIAKLYAEAGAKVMLNGFGKPEEIAAARAEIGADGRGRGPLYPAPTCPSPPRCAPWWPPPRLSSASSTSS